MMRKLSNEEFDNLFYLCSLIEFIRRKTNNMSKDIVNKMGIEELSTIYNIADVLHCDSFEEISDLYISKLGISVLEGKTNHDSSKEYIPFYTKIGKAFAYFIQELYIYDDRDIIGILLEVYNSWIVEYIEDYESDFYYLGADYKKCCYEEGRIIPY